MSISKRPQTEEEIAQDAWREKVALEAAHAINREYDENTMTSDDLNAIINRYTNGDIQAGCMALIIVIEVMCGVCNG